MRFAIILVVAILAVAFAKPHSKRSSESFSSVDPKYRNHHEHHHKHSHRPHTPPVPVTEEVVTFTPEYPAMSDVTSEASELNTQDIGVTTTPEGIIITDDVTTRVTAGPDVRISSKSDVTVEVVTIVA